MYHVSYTVYQTYYLLYSIYYMLPSFSGAKVDFCARSVIGGDPNLDTEQVGVPRPGARVPPALGAPKAT